MGSDDEDTRDEGGGEMLAFAYSLDANGVKCWLSGKKGYILSYFSVQLTDCSSYPSHSRYTQLIISSFSSLHLTILKTVIMSGYGNDNDNQNQNQGGQGMQLTSCLPLEYTLTI